MKQKRVRTMYIRAGNLREFFQFYPIVSVLMMINVMLFILTTVPLFPNRLIFEAAAGVNILIANGEMWRLFTPIFIHNHFAHLFFNMFALFIFGTILEPFIKKTTFLLIYLSTGFFANVITYIFAPLTFVHVGASGAIFGIFGVVAVFIWLKKFPPRDAQIFAWAIGLAIAFSFFQKGVNVYAHIGGFLCGLLCGFWIIRRQIN